MRFGILGSFEAADDHGREVPLGGHRQRAVLAILLLHADEVVSSDRLIDELWGDRAPATAAKTIQVYISKLRRALGAGVVLTRSGGYVLDSERADVDANRFEALVAEGRRALQTNEPRQLFSASEIKLSAAPSPQIDSRMRPSCFSPARGRSGRI